MPSFFASNRKAPAKDAWSFLCSPNPSPKKQVSVSALPRWFPPWLFSTNPLWRVPGFLAGLPSRSSSFLASCSSLVSLPSLSPCFRGLWGWPGAGMFHSATTKTSFNRKDVSKRSFALSRKAESGTTPERDYGFRKDSEPPISPGGVLTSIASDFLST